MGVYMSKHEALLACYKSGQMSEAQWVAHLRDPLFAAYIARQQ
jgi:hypothetical protein